MQIAVRLMRLASLFIIVTAGCNDDSAPRDKRVNSDDVKLESATAKAPISDVNGAEVVVARRLSPPSPAAGDAPLFTSLPAEQTGVDFQLQLSDPRKHIREYTHLTPYGGVCTGDFDGDGLVDFYVTSNRGSGRLFRNLGEFRFDDVTEAVGVYDADFWSTGAALVDVNNDGALDLYVCGYNQPNRCFINQGADGAELPTFVDRAKALGIDYNGASMTMAFADIDNDGDLDGYLATTAKAPPPGTKFAVRMVDGKPIVPKHLKEYWELIYLPGDRAHRTEAGQFDHLFRNDGTRFTEITESAGIDGPYFTLAALWWDYNRDGFPDVYVSNDYSGPDFLYQNNGDGTFSNVANDVLPHSPWFSMGSDVADVNNDGLIDLLATDMSARSPSREKMMMHNVVTSMGVLDVINPRQRMRNALYLNSGLDRMREGAELASMASTEWTWNPRLADFDNDGDVDAFITNGILRDMMNADLARQADQNFTPNSPEWINFWATQPFRKEPNIALRNDGDLRFADVSEQWGLQRLGVSFGASSADFDGDGDLDLVVSNADVPVSLYRNNSQEGARLLVSLRGVQSNRFGLGATIQVEAAGQTQTQYVTASRGWLSAVGPETHFGIVADAIDQLTIRWPSGAVQTFRDLDVNTHYTIREQDDAAPSDDIAPTPLFASQPDLSAFDLATIEHREPPFDDYRLQPLLPYRLSQLGPAMAWGDVDGDGRDDCYLGGSVGVGGQLLINNGQGKLEQRRVGAFDNDRRSEDVAACWFDADGDGDFDLYVVSGSVEFPVDDAAYQDRLYLNDGRGKLARAEDALPPLRDSGGAIAACDFDKDGDVDLFVGSRCVPGAYPSPPRNRLLINEQGRFRESASDAFANAGMATDATWADVDGDQWNDLIVTVDRGPVRLFANRGGELVETTSEAGLDGLRGWWQAIDAGDVDQDGDIDFVVGNLGLNTRYQASRDRPEVICYGDFDDSQRPHILEVTYDGSMRVPRRGLDSLHQAMPSLAATVDSFQQYARASVDDWIDSEALNQALVLESNTLESGVLYNDGAGVFRFEPLPADAQLAPCRGVAVADLNQDGRLDVALAQNFFAVNAETGAMDGGTGAVLLGRPSGGFSAMSPRDSGVVVPGDAASVAAVDLNGDGLLDLVFALNDGPLTALEGQAGD